MAQVPPNAPSAEFQQSRLLSAAGFTHAFFTRHGGVSPGAYASLNFSYAVEDDAANVDENLARAARALGIARDQLYFPSQIHTDGVHELYGGEPPLEILHTEADALVSGAPNLACGVRSADCLPILIADPTTGRAAAVHAGWRGLVCRVLGRAIERLGGSPHDHLAAIGPHISAAAFEVSEEVAQELTGASANPEVVQRHHGPRPHVDLEAVARAQLLEHGLTPSHIERVGGCTQLEPQHYFSFRRDGRHSGRHLSAIVARRPV